MRDPPPPGLCARARRGDGWHDLMPTRRRHKSSECAHQVRRWLAFVEGLYQDNPYHSSTHAADVLQVEYWSKYCHPTLP